MSSARRSFARVLVVVVSGFSPEIIAISGQDLVCFFELVHVHVFSAVLRSLIICLDGAQSSYFFASSSSLRAGTAFPSQSGASEA